MLRSLKLRLVLVGTGLKSHRSLLWDLSTIGRSSSGSDWHGMEKLLRSKVFDRNSDISWLLLRLLLVTGLDVFLSLQHLGIAHTQPTWKWFCSILCSCPFESCPSYSLCSVTRSTHSCFRFENSSLSIVGKTAIASTFISQISQSIRFRSLLLFSVFRCDFILLEYFQLRGNYLLSVLNEQLQVSYDIPKTWDSRNGRSFITTLNYRINFHTAKSRFIFGLFRSSDPWLQTEKINFRR